MISLRLRAPDREPLLRRITEQLEADVRVAAAWLAGSIGRGEDDAWSDLDLHVAVYDQHLSAFWENRPTLYKRVGRPLLIQQEMPSNAQAGSDFPNNGSSSMDRWRWIGTLGR